MQVRIAVLADFASFAVGNKLNILGIFTIISTEKVPAIHPQMQLVTSFEFDSSEAGDKPLRIVLVNEDGKELFSISGTLHVERDPHGNPTLLNQVFNLNNMPFPDFGGYEFRIYVDNEVVSNVSLNVVEVSPESQ